MTNSSGFGPGTPAGIPDLPPPPMPSQWSPPSSTPVTGAHTADTSSAPTSTADVAKDKAASVAGGAADAAKDVAGTAKEQVGQVAGEAKKQVKDFVGQAQSELTDQAQTQQQRVAGGLHSVSDQLRSLAQGDAQQGPATDLAHQAADKVSELAGFFENRQPGEVLTEVKRYAQRNPGMFLALSLGAGILAGRLTRGLTAGDDSSSTPSSPIGDTAALTGAGYRPALGSPTTASGTSPGQVHWSADPEVGR